MYVPSRTNTVSLITFLYFTSYFVSSYHILLVQSFNNRNIYSPRWIATDNKVRKVGLYTGLRQTKNDYDTTSLVNPGESSSSSVQQSFSWEDTQNRAKWSSRLILLIVSAFYGTNFGCVKILGETLHPGVAAAIRFSIATAVFFPQLQSVFQSNRKLILCGMEVGIYSAIGYFAQATALLTTRASNAAFICSLAVIVVPIIDALFGEKKDDRNILMTLFPAILAAVGVGCLELGGTSLPGLGDLWAFLQPIFFGLGFWRIERHMRMVTEPKEAQAYTGAMMMMVAAMSFIWMFTGFIIPVSQFGEEIFRVSINSQIHSVLTNWHVIASLLWTGIVTTALTSYGENIAMQKLDAAESTVIYSTEPLWGTAFAALTLGESVGWNTAVGAALILCACMWSSLGPQITSAVSAALFAETGEDVVENMSENIQKLYDLTKMSDMQ